MIDTITALMTHYGVIIVAAVADLDPAIGTWLITGAGTILSGAIGKLWTTCNRLAKQMITLSEEIGELRGRQAAVTEFGNSVLSVVAARTAPPSPPATYPPASSHTDNAQGGATNE